MDSRVKPGLRWAGPLAALVLLSACHSTPKPAEVKPLDIQVDVIAAADLNPDRHGRPSPVLVWVYQLRDGSKFLSSEFEDLTTRGSTSLAGESLGRLQLTAYPGTVTPLPLRIDPQTQLLGVVAEYSDEPNSSWRAVSPAPAAGFAQLLKKQSLVIQLHSRVVEVQTAPRKRGP